jgi:hypothetical protein
MAFFPTSGPARNSTHVRDTAGVQELFAGRLAGGPPGYYATENHLFLTLFGGSLHVACGGVLRGKKACGPAVSADRRSDGWGW